MNYYVMLVKEYQGYMLINSYSFFFYLSIKKCIIDKEEVKLWKDLILIQKWD